MSPRGLRATGGGPFPGTQTGRFAACALAATIGCLAGQQAGAGSPVASESFKPNTRSVVTKDSKVAANAVVEPVVDLGSTLWTAFESTLTGFKGPLEVVDSRDKWARDITLRLGSNDGGTLGLLLTIPQHQTVSVHVPGTSTVRLGTFTNLPPTIFTQWHFNPAGRLKPYVGAGLNLTATMRQRVAVDDGAGGVRQLELDSAIVSPAIQAGLDFAIDRRWSASFDVRKIWVESDVVTDDHSRVGNAMVDPAQYALRMNYRF